MRMSISDAHVVKTEPLDGQQARWAKLVLTTYKDPAGKTRTWESGERLTRPKGSDIDGVGIVAILENPSSSSGSAARTETGTTSSSNIDLSRGPALLLQKQYRPAVDKVCIEVPAGLVDEGETAGTCAVRELEEETGYIGSVIEDGTGFGASPVMFNDPGFCNTNLRMIHVSVDMSDERNQSPKPKLEPGEFIESFSVPLKDLYQACRKLEQEGYAIDARVGTLAEGIEVAKRWKL